jgi:hypothetical protein
MRPTAGGNLHEFGADHESQVGIQNPIGTPASGTAWFNLASLRSSRLLRSSGLQAVVDGFHVKVLGVVAAHPLPQFTSFRSLGLVQCPEHIRITRKTPAILRWARARSRQAYRQGHAGIVRHNSLHHG